MYDGLMAMENNAIPYEFGDIGNLNVKTSSTSGMGDIAYYELTHAGVLPSANTLANDIKNNLISGGLAYLSVYAYALANFILASLIDGFALNTNLIFQAAIFVGIGASTAGVVVATIGTIIIAA